VHAAVCWNFPAGRRRQDCSLFASSYIQIHTLQSAVCKLPAAHDKLWSQWCGGFLRALTSDRAACACAGRRLGQGEVEWQRPEILLGASRQDQERRAFCAFLWRGSNVPATLVDGWVTALDWRALVYVNQPVAGQNRATELPLVVVARARYVIST
jgi:hypothetical protein